MSKDSRRSSDTVIINMAQDLGELKGATESFIESQKEINTTLTELQTKHDDRLMSLEETRTKSKAYLVAGATIAGGAGGTIQAWLHKVLGWL